MSDGIQLNPMVGGDKVDTEDNGLRGELQRVKIATGAVDTDGGDVTSSNPLPVHDAGPGLPANAAQEGGGNLAATATNTINLANVTGGASDTAVTTNTTGSLSGKLRGLVAIFADVWDSVNHWFNINLRTLISGENQDDNVLNVAEWADGQNLAASGLVKPGGGLFYGWIVSNHTSGTLQFFDGNDNTGEVITGVITFPVGPGIWKLPGARRFNTGLYAQIGGTINFTPFFK